MGYEELLSAAYEQVTPVESCERFEILKVRGHHEGTKTIIKNFSQISSCIRRDLNHLMKFLSKELASSTELSGDRLILSRKLPSAVINEKVEKYVRQFVTCNKCGKPDTELIKEKNQSLLRCLACGAKYAVHDI